MNETVRNTFLLTADISALIHNAKGRERIQLTTQKAFLPNANILPLATTETATLKRNGSKHDSQITLRISAALVSLFARKHFLSNLQYFANMFAKYCQLIIKYCE